MLGGRRRRGVVGHGCILPRRPREGNDVSMPTYEPRPEDLFNDPHLVASGGFAEITLMNGTKTQVPMLPIEMDGRRFRTRLDLPKVGEHTREMLAALGYSQQDIERLIAGGVAHAA